MYRRIVRIRVRRPDVLKFLLQERKFPRAFYHAICEVEDCLKNMPRNKACIKQNHRLQKTVLAANPEKLKQAELHRFIDRLQLGLITLHNTITDTYFLSQE
jgi:uncharacterized alpha-E superfamily protein